MWRWIALISAVVLIIAMAGVIVSFQPPVEPPQLQTAEKDHAENRTRESKVGLFDRWFPDSTTVFNLFLVIFTAVLAFVGIIQLNFLTRAEQIATSTAQSAKDSAEAAKKSAEVATQTLIASQRAWISAGPPQLIGEIKAGVPINIELAVQNVGKDPAIGVSQHGAAMAFDMPEQISYAPEIWNAGFEQVIRMECDLAAPIKGRATIFPGAGIFIPIRWENQQVIQGLIGRKKLLVLYGCIGYITMGENHFTPYCFYMTADKDTPNVWRFGSAPIGNDAT